MAPPSHAETAAAVIFLEPRRARPRSPGRELWIAALGAALLVAALALTARPFDPRAGGDAAGSSLVAD